MRQCCDPFFEQLQSSKIDGDFLIFNEPTRFKMFNGEIKEVFIRESYARLYDNLAKTVAEDFFITGTPGIGKSFFAFYLMYKLIKEGKSFIYEPKLNEDVTLFRGAQNCFETYPSRFISDFQQQEKNKFKF